MSQCTIISKYGKRTRQLKFKEERTEFSLKKQWRPGGGGTLGIFGWGCAAGTLEPLAFTRASFRWILLPYTRVNSPNHSYPRVLLVTKNSTKRVLTLSLDASLRFSTPNPGRVAAGVAGYMLHHAKYVRTHYLYKLFNFNQY